MDTSSVLKDDLPKWQRMLKDAPPSTVLREIAGVYKLGRPELAMLLGALFERSISTIEVQAVWHWDLANLGRGYTDLELDERLSKPL